MHRIIFSFLLLCLVAPMANAATSPKPNFVIIFADDQGYGDLGCFGSTKIKTPNIDRIAKEGRRFTNFMVAYLGIPYSNDMNHPDNKGKPRVPSDDLWRDQKSAITLWNIPLIEQAL